MSSPTDIPVGFQPDPRIQPHTFAGLVGPFYSLRQGNDLSLGLRIEERHCNSRGTCHGGLLATLADIALGYACALAGDANGKPVVRISANFRMARTRTPETENSPEN